MDGYLDQQVPYTLANVRMVVVAFVVVFATLPCRAFCRRAPGFSLFFFRLLHEFCVRAQRAPMFFCFRFICINFEKALKCSMSSEAKKKLPGAFIPGDFHCSDKQKCSRVPSGHFPRTRKAARRFHLHHSDTCCAPCARTSARRRRTSLYPCFVCVFVQKSHGNGPLNRLLMAAKRKYMETELPPQESEGKKKKKKNKL